MKRLLQWLEIVELLSGMLNNLFTNIICPKELLKIHRKHLKPLNPAARS